MLALGAQMQWFLGALATMKAGQFPNLKALVYLDSTNDCGWNVDSSSASLAGYSEMGADAFFRP